jgi:hypothetical protein
VSPGKKEMESKLRTDIARFQYQPEGQSLILCTVCVPVACVRSWSTADASGREVRCQVCLLVLHGARMVWRLEVSFALDRWG